MSSCKIMAAGAQKNDCFQQLWYQHGRKAIYVRLSRSHTHPSGPSSFVLKALRDQVSGEDTGTYEWV